MDVFAILNSLKGKALDLRDIELLRHAYELQDQNVRQLKENNEAIKESQSMLKARIVELETEVQTLRAANARLQELVDDYASQNSDTFAATHDSDILVLLQSWIGSRTEKENQTAIKFLATDKALELPPGSTKKHIEEAAKRNRYAVAERGEQSILLHKIHDVPKARVFHLGS